MRNNKLIVYGSSYDRGLEHLLKMWPDIKKEVPEAQLHVFYGWNLFDVGYRDNPERMAWKEKMNGLMKQEGITHLGRISHGGVLKEMEIAGIWAYPTHFGDISCITAMKAQAMGAIPCVVNYAALKETVQYGVKVEGDIYDPETKEAFKKELIALLKDDKRQEEIRKEMMPWAQEKFKWEHVAKQWDEEFRFEVPAEERAMELIMKDEPLEALKLLKEDSPLKEKLTKKLAHIFNPEKYKEKYANDKMDWKPTDVIYNRHGWILKEAKKAKSLLDLGCYEGTLVNVFVVQGYAKGVEMCKEAVKFARSQGKGEFVEGDATTYQDDKKYDAVCACELIEHLPDPRKLIDNMLSLVSKDGWCYISTPNGQLDYEGTKKVWETEGALIDHVRAYDREKIKDLLEDCEYEILEYERELFVKFRKKVEKNV